MIFELLNQFLFLFVHCPLSIVNLNPRCAKTDTNIREPFITSEDFEYARTLMKKLKSPDTGAERIDNIAPNVTKPDYRPNLSEGDVNFRGRPLRFAVDHINNIPMVHDDVIDLDNAVSDKLKIWTFGLVPHRVSLKFNDTQRAIIAMAMEEFHNKTCIQWIKARPHEQDYVMLDLAPNPTCSSEIGKNPGKNQMLLSPICLENMGNIVHEMMHALGFIHEHCRHDRDKYVDIQWDNIPNGRFNKNYLIYGLDVIDNLNTNYDYSSVMHYPRYNKGKEIVVPKIDVKIGQRDGLSPNDVYKIKKLYNCDGADDLAPICDRKIECVRKAQDGYCKTNSVEMLQNCSSYCALCSKNIEPESTMIIEDQYCYAFASLGLCEINPRHMKTYCQTACGTQGATVENADNFTTNYPSDCKSTLNTDSRTITFENRCRYTVWPGMLPNIANDGGWEMTSGAKTTINVPDNFSAGRFWGRTLCDVSTGHCVTGDCANRIKCAGAGGEPPATLAEFTLGDTDFFDVSLVDGYNLPLSIYPQGGTGSKCSRAGCTFDLDSICPEALQSKNNDKVVQCFSACSKFNTDQYCCRGQYGTPDKCIPTQWPTNYAAIFKRACPQAYSYAYDDQTSTFTCKGKPNYKIIFCG